MSDCQQAGQPRVVVVEDQTTSREMLRRLLELHGYQTYAAADSQAGMALIYAERPEVALIDIGLPDTDGLETARRLRRDPRSNRTVLIALSGRGEATDLAASREAGFDAHLVKPVEFSELSRILQSCAMQAQRPRA